MDNIQITATRAITNSTAIVTHASPPEVPWWTDHVAACKRRTDGKDAPCTCGLDWYLTR